MNMPNLRIISDNALDRAVTLTTNSAANGFPVANLKTDVKSNVWRSTGISESIGATWATPEAIRAIVLPICNLSPTAVANLRVSTEISTTNYVRSSDVYSGWIDNGSGTWVPNFGLAPNGTTTTTKALVKASGSTVGDRYHAIDGMPAGTMTFSMFAKAGTATQINLYVDFSAGGAATAAFNLLNGEFILTPSATALWAKSTSLSGKPGWLRIEMAMAVPAGSLYLHCQVTGALSSWAEVWGAQLEYGGVSTSLYITTGAAAARPSGYIDNWQFYGYDSGNFYPSPAPAMRPRGWSAAQAASAYAYGGGACARHWLPAELQATGVALTITDASNLQGYLEAAKLIIGPYWSPTYNASDASLTMVDSTALYRTDAGNQGSDAGTIYRQVSIDMSSMPAADRTVCAKFLRNSRAYPIFLSLFPESADLELERDNSVYGRRTQDSELFIQNSIYYGTKIPVEEI